MARVLRPGGIAAVTVPAWLPERICWRLSDDYHNVPAGHLRIFTRAELETKLARAGLTVGGHHHAHALHSPYWWLKCAVGVHDDKHPLASAYHKLLVWDIMRKPAVTRLADRALNPLIGKSLVVYATSRSPPSHRRDRSGPARPRSGDDERAARSRLSSACGGRTSSGSPRVPRPRRCCRGTRHPDRRASPGHRPQHRGRQQPDGAIGWPDGHVDAWNHVECAMALSRVRAAATRRGAPTPGCSPPSGRTDPGPALATAAWSPRTRPRATTPPTRGRRLARAPRHRRRGVRRTGCGQLCAAAIDFALGLQTAARRDHLAARTRTEPRPAMRCWPAAPACTRRFAARSPWPSTSASRSRTGSWPLASSGTRSPAIPRRSRTRARSRWTGTTRCSAGALRGAAAESGWQRAGIRSWCPASGPVRQRPALGHRRRDVRARDRAGR